MGYTTQHAVENPLTSLAADAEHMSKMIAQEQGAVLLAGHPYRGAVITEAGNAPDVAGLVYIAVFAREAGESLSAIAGAVARASFGKEEEARHDSLGGKSIAAGWIAYSGRESTDGAKE
jgi:hypothetical protein